MRFLKVTPVIAILALAACGDQQTAETEEPAPPPVAEAPADEVPAGEAPAGEAPADDAAVADAPADAMPEPPEGMPEDLPRTADAPPAPSSVFEEGVDALGDIDETVHSVFADAPFGAGDYRAEGFTLSINEDGDFTLEIEADERTLTGDLRVYGDMFTMSNIDQATDPGEFPMTCLVTSAPDGFELAADGPSCGMFDGLIFARVE
ncbi:MAG: hypothetical protein JJU21_13850 [Salinarimonas sp.]|nr:hypothetical protein [Salinarimonas sp.]